MGRSNGHSIHAGLKKRIDVLLLWSEYLELVEIMQEIFPKNLV